MATDPYTGTDLLAGSKRMMLAEAIRRAGQPNRSLGGALLNGLAAGLWGVYDAQDEKNNAALMDKMIGGGSPMGNSAASTPSANTLAIPPQALSDKPLADTDVALSGGQLPKGIDRSGLAQQLQDPAMVQRMASMVKGETGYNNPDLAQIQTESALNRAQARGIPLTQALLSVSDDPKRGYYASNTYARPASTADVERFKPILAKVLAGSDLGTEKLGFTPTGNASGPFALNREAGGVYANSGWPSGQPGQGEMYALEKPDAAAVQSLPRVASLGPMLGPPQAPAQLQPGMPQVPPQAGLTPPTGPQPNVATLPVRPANVPPTMPVPTQVAQAGGVPPIQQALPPNPQTQRLMEMYRVATPQEKLRLGPMILQLQAEERKQGLELQRQLYLKQQPGYGDIPANAAAIAAAKSGAELPNQMTLKAAPAFSDIPANAGAIEAAKVAAKNATEKQIAKEYGQPMQTANLGIIRENVDNAINLINKNPNMAGPMARTIGSWVPGSVSKDVNQTIDTLKSITTIDQLSLMRQSSPTGGALGSVSNYEDQMLARARGSLDTAQSNEQLIYNMRRLQRVAEAIANPQAKTPEEQNKLVTEAFEGKGGAGASPLEAEMRKRGLLK